MFIIGNYVPYRIGPIIMIAINVLFLCIFPFFHETPQSLLKKNKEKVCFALASSKDILL